VSAKLARGVLRGQETLITHFLVMVVRFHFQLVIVVCCDACVVVFPAKVSGLPVWPGGREGPHLRGPKPHCGPSGWPGGRETRDGYYTHTHTNALGFSSAG
jgi:hypothetical protein